jgi:hypothetical protein
MYPNQIRCEAAGALPRRGVTHINVSKSGDRMQKRFEGAQTLSDFIASAEENRELWQSIYARAAVSDDVLELARQLPAKRHLLVLVEDWCGDAFNSVPFLARLADAVADKLELRVLRRDENLDLMDAHLSPRGGRAIPAVIVLDENFAEIGWWGSRPAELQAWIDETGASLEKAERYRQIRIWYSRDRGVSTLTEVLAVAGAPVATPAASPSPTAGEMSSDVAA